MTEPELHSIILAVKAGRRDAFGQLFDHWYPMAVSYAAQLLGDYDLARDAAQEVMIRVWQKRETLDPSRPALGFMLRSVRNHCLNVLRDGRKTTLVADMKEHTLELEPEEKPIDQSALLRKLMDKLPERQREALVLSRFDGQSHEQIAEIMQISARTVNNHIVQALKTLRKFRSLLLENG